MLPMALISLSSQSFQNSLQQEGPRAEDGVLGVREGVEGGARLQAARPDVLPVAVEGVELSGDGVGHGDVAGGGVGGGHGGRSGSGEDFTTLLKWSSIAV